MTGSAPLPPVAAASPASSPFAPKLSRSGARSEDGRRPRPIKAAKARPRKPRSQPARPRTAAAPRSTSGRSTAGMPHRPRQRNGEREILDDKQARRRDRSAPRHHRRGLQVAAASRCRRWRRRRASFGSTCNGR
jgi:hypothetical protein